MRKDQETLLVNTGDDGGSHLFGIDRGLLDQRRGGALGPVQHIGAHSLRAEARHFDAEVAIGDSDPFGKCSWS